MKTKVISFRITAGEAEYLDKVKDRFCEESAAAGHVVSSRVVFEMSTNTFAKIVFYHGLDHILDDNRVDLNRGATTTPPMGAK